MAEVAIRHHGRTIRGTLTYPTGKRQNLRAVLLTHGLSGDRNWIWYPEFRRSLVRRGYVVLALDLNGHGQSNGRFEEFTYTKAIADVTAAAAFLQRQPGIVPNGVAGLGMSLSGAVMVLARAAGVPFDALVLLAPVGDLQTLYRRDYTPAELRRWKRSGLLTWYQKRLKMMLTLRYAYYADALRYDTLRAAANIHQPVLLVHGVRDKGVPIVGSRRLVRRLQGPTRFVALPNSGHTFRRTDERRRLFREVGEWLDRFHAPRQSRVIDIFIQHHGRLLILQRSGRVGHYRKLWAPITGYEHEGRTALAQAYVEAHEEVGLSRKQLKLVTVGRRVRVRDDSVDKTWIITPVLFTATTERVRSDWEHTKFRWVRPGQFPFARSLPDMRRVMRRVGLA